MNRNAPLPRRGERGIALVIVLLVLILTSILALEIKSTAKNKRNSFLMQQAMAGQLEILKQVLLFDAKENQVEKLDDAWNDEKYTDFQEGPTEEDLEDRDPSEPISSEGFELKARVEDEGRKFNLKNLIVEDEEQRKHWERIFIRLLVQFREDHGIHALTESAAEDVLKDVKEWFERKDDERGLPVPAVKEGAGVMLTPDELLLVEGIDRDLWFDRKPEEEFDDTIPGLYRYLTLWSEGRINLNTADPVVVRALFDPQDEQLAEDFLVWRDEEAEEQPEDLGLDDEPVKNALTAVADLNSLDGFDPEVVARNRFGQVLGFQGDVFSIHLEAEDENGLRRQERWVVRRNPAGVTTLLFEERNDPAVEEEEE